MATQTMRTPTLADDLLERFGERAAAYDRENRFFSEDFEDLRRAGYLLLAVPEELGGRGLSTERRLRGRSGRIAQTGGNDRHADLVLLARVHDRAEEDIGVGVDAEQLDR